MLPRLPSATLLLLGQKGERCKPTCETWEPRTPSSGLLFQHPSLPSGLSLASTARAVPRGVHRFWGLRLIPTRSALPMGMLALPHICSFAMIYNLFLSAGEK